MDDVTHLHNWRPCGHVSARAWVTTLTPTNVKADLGANGIYPKDPSMIQVKLDEKAQIRNRYNRILHPAQDTQSGRDQDGPLLRFYSQSASAVWDYILSPKSVWKIVPLR